ncbi:diguanylate cyclase domain-containing protein [Roseateles sp. BYS180W]|uniref:Diguanylate cyclase domain-containing protein n=1 Tax=Roseateles rivi TaxID=3299028 RepID=A0ABW7FWQ4_9BURK
MLIRNKLAWHRSLQMALTLMCALAVVQLYVTYRQYARAELHLRQSDALVALMQKSSDDLTQMARLYVVTREPRFRSYYRSIWRIRAGQEAPAADYDATYWDRMAVAGASAPLVVMVPASAPQSLMQRMHDVGLDAEEARLLSTSHQRSEALIALEEEAMGLVDKADADAGSDSPWRRAVDLLHGEQYRHAKAQIMQPLSDLRQRLQSRSALQWQAAEAQLSRAIWMAAVALVLLALNALLVSVALARQVRRPIEALQAWAHGVRQGRLELRTRLSDPNEFGELSAAIDQMADAVQQNHSALREEVERRARAEEAVRHLANHDALTGLPSLRLLHDRLERALLGAQRHKQRLAVLFVDLNEFKPVNDTYGHHMGDEVLKVIGERLSTSVREADTVGRIGGDEFVLILPDVGDDETVQRLCDKLLEQIAQPIHLPEADAPLVVSAAIGVAVFPEDGSSVHMLLRLADRDMYRRKSRRPLLDKGEALQAWRPAVG